MYKNIPFVHNSHSAKAKQLEQEGNSGTTDKYNNLSEKQSCLIALKSTVIILMASPVKKKKKLETTLSFGGIFAPRKNKFKGKKQKQKESAHQDF